MTPITIVLTDLPEGRGIAVQTDADTPRVGEKCSPSQALAMDLLRTCRVQGATAQHGTFSHSQAMQLLKDLLDPEELGHAVTPEVRDRARICLGMLPVESHFAAAGTPC